jgi:ABC-type multidrug transport system fused ATPase/permease subunit
MTSASTQQIHFDASRVAHLTALAVMTFLVAGSLQAYFPLIAAIALAIVLTWAFSTLVKISVITEFARLRFAAIAAALIIGVVTVGSSSAKIYAGGFGQASLVRDLTQQRSAALASIDRTLGDARAARSQLEIWAKESSRLALLEATNGGTCAGLSRSRGVRGPITFFREADATEAAALSAGIEAAVAPLERSRAAIPAEMGIDMTGALDDARIVNAAIKEANALISGAALSGARATLERRLSAEPESGRCLDAARASMIQSAVTAVFAVTGTPRLAELSPPIDLRSEKEVTSRGLLRAGNLLMAALTFGAVANFDDDPLLKAGLKRGVLNTETLAVFVALIIELSVVVTSILAGRKVGVPIFPFDPRSVAEYIEAQGSTRGHKRGYIVAALFRAVTNLIATDVSKASDKGRSIFMERRVGGSPMTDVLPLPVFDSALIETAQFVVDFLLRSEDLLVIPENGPSSALAAARELEARGVAARRVIIPENAEHAAPEINRAAPWMVRGSRHIVYALRTDFAVAVRREYMLTAVKKVA